MYLLIGKNNCKYCSDLKNELDRKNIPYTYLNQKNCNADILEACVNANVKFYPFVLKIQQADNINELIKSISN
jgi:glutaredoxin